MQTRLSEGRRSPEPETDPERVERRSSAVDRRETAVGLREVAVDRREKNLETQIRTEAVKSRGVAEQARRTTERLLLANEEAQAQTVAAEHAAADMAYLAEHDFLTKLPNRALFANRLEAALASAAERGRKVGVMYLDLDHFKHINDTFGHEAGDQVLMVTAQRLQAAVRRTDTICRQGGDEFLVLLPDLKDLKEAVLIAGKVVAAMGQPQEIASHTLVVTISVGISLYPELGGESGILITNADQAMYQAKAKGGNNGQVFNPDERS